MTVIRSWQFLLSMTSGAAILLSIVSFVIAGLNGSWHSLLTAVAYMIAYSLAVLGLLIFAAGAFASDRPLRWIVLIIGGVMIVGGAHYVSIAIAREMRDRDIQRALDAGLESDCRAIFAAFHGDPRFKEEGYLRVFRDSKEFDSLPASIRMFNPVYVTIEDHPFNSDMPPNVGLCKNGFGGFAFGVRVLIEDKDFPEPFWKKRVSKSVYLWQEET